MFSQASVCPREGGGCTSPRQTAPPPSPETATDGTHPTGMLSCPCYIIKMRTSCFDTDFISQMKMTTIPLIHCFVTHTSKMASFEFTLQ